MAGDESVKLKKYRTLLLPLLIPLHSWHLLGDGMIGVNEEK